MFKDDYSFRRFAVVLVIGLTAWITSLSVSYATTALEAGVDWAGTLAILGALNTPVVGLAGYVFKLYNDARSKI